MRCWVAMRKSACVWMLLPFNLKSSQAQLTPYGSFDQWEITDSSWQLAAPGPGAAWLCFCNLSPDPLEGLSFAFRWSQWLSGSNLNFSRVHFLSEIPFEPGSVSETIAPFPISGWEFNSAFAEGSFLHLGQNGSNDSIQWLGYSGQTSSNYEMLSPTEQSHFPGELDHWIYWDQPPNSDTATLSLAHQSSPDVKIKLAVGPHEQPKCIGFSCQFTATHTHDFHWQWSYFGEFQPDSMAPRLMGFQWNNPNAIELHFSESLLPHHGEVIGADGTTIPASLEMAAPQNRWLLPPMEWEPGTERPLLLTGFSDLEGNLMSDTTVLVPKTLGLALRPSDVIVSEIMADPSPPVGWPEVEWVEIHNNSESFIALDQLLWWDESSTGFKEMIPATEWNGVLEPDSRCVLSSGAYHIGLEAVHQAHLNPWPSLSNEGEGIGIFDHDGTPLDLVFYDPSWWSGSDGGHSLERISADDCSGPSNWSISTSTQGGTPGLEPIQGESIPSLSADTLNIVEVVPTSPHSAMVVFNADIDPMSLISCSNGNAWVDEKNPQIVQWKSMHASNENRMQWEMEGIKACHRNIPSYGRFSVNSPFHRFPESGDLVITEVNHAPQGPGLIHGSFVEVMNISNDTLEAGGLSCNNVSLNSRRTLPPNARICFDDVELGKTSGWIRVFSPAQAVLDSLSYDACWHQDRRKTSEGFSLVRLNPRCSGNSHKNWDSSQHPSGNSYEAQDPAENPGCPDSIGSPLICGRISDHYLLYFSSPTIVKTPHWIPVSTESFGSWASRYDLNQLWAIESPSSSPEFIATADSIYRIDHLCEVSSEMVDSTLLFLHEIQVNMSSGPEPFVEFYHSNASPVSTSAYLWTSASLPFPSDWLGLFEAVHWFIPPKQPWGLATCPQRLDSQTGQVLPAQMPSLWNVTELRWTIGDAVPKQVNLDSMNSSMLYGQARTPSWEWAPSAFLLGGTMDESGSGQWLPSLDSRGSTPGEINSWGAWTAISEDANAPLRVIHDTWKVQSQRPEDFIQINLRPPTPGRWRIELSVMDATGHVNAIPLRNSAELMGGQTARFNWDGSFEDGQFAPPGPYLLQGYFQQLDGPSQYLYTHPVHVTRW